MAICKSSNDLNYLNWVSYEIPQGISGLGAPQIFPKDHCTQIYHLFFLKINRLST